MKGLILLVALFIPFLTSCAAERNVTPHEASATSQVGADRDEAGCISSAGYSWCERTMQCERPWELAKKENFVNTQEAFDEYCGKNK